MPDDDQPAEAPAVLAVLNIGDDHEGWALGAGQPPGGRELMRRRLEVIGHPTGEVGVRWVEGGVVRETAPGEVDAAQLLAFAADAAQPVLDARQPPPEPGTRAVADLLRELHPERFTPVRACRECGCTDADCRECIAATGQPCSWVEADLCSRCATTPAPAMTGPQDPTALPPVIVAGPFVYRITDDEDDWKDMLATDGGPHGSGGAWGHTSYRRGMVEVDPGIRGNPGLRRMVLMHEALHIASLVAGPSDDTDRLTEEGWVSAVAAPLLDLLRRSPGFVGWLLADD